MYVEIKNLSFKYHKNQREVIKDFNLEIEKTEIVAILGQSGSGKSTLLRLISGLETPNKGEICIHHQVMVNDKIFVEPEKRAVGMVFQDYALFPHMTVNNNISYGLKKMSKLDKLERVKAVLEIVNLQDYSTRYPYELSGGQQQRVALARAIAPTPSLLLLDEPFSNLDSNLKTKIRDELKSILKKTKSTSIFVTHDYEDAVSLADKIVFLNQGKVEKIVSTNKY